jgi:hypothetical protein
VTAVEGGGNAKDKKNRQQHTVKEYIKIKVNGNNYDHIREQMDEFVTDFKKANINHRHCWEGASNSELPPLKIIEDIYIQNTAKEKRDTQEPEHSGHRKLMDRDQTCMLSLGTALLSVMIRV